MAYPELKTDIKNSVPKNKWYVNIFAVCLALDTAASTASTVIKFFRNIYTELLFNWISVFIPLAFSLVIPAVLIILAFKKSGYFKDILLLYSFLNIISAFHINYIAAGIQQLSIGLPILAGSMLYVFAMLIPFSDKIRSIKFIKPLACAAVIISKLLSVYVFFASYSSNRLSLAGSVLSCIAGVCTVLYFCDNKDEPACFNRYKPFGSHYKKIMFIAVPCALSLILGISAGLIGPTQTLLYVSLNYCYELLTLYIKIFFIVIAVKAIRSKALR